LSARGKLDIVPLTIPLVRIPIVIHIGAGAAVLLWLCAEVADLSSTAPPAHKVVWGVVDFGRGCLLRDDIDCPVYELIGEVGVMLDPFRIEAVVVFAAGDVEPPPQTRLTQVHIEL
tara:strand:+ start:137 stop:484 length:348 start_codon:yes stop_codon:yes gene_type:complete